MLKNICLGIAIVGMLQFTSADAAVTIVSENIIESGIFGRDFTRIRSKDGVDTFEFNDATIISQNDIDGDFGVYNNDNVTYTHQLGWAGLSGGNFVDAMLEIAAFGTDDNNDDVYIGVNLDEFIGSLIEGGASTLFISVTEFDLSLHLSLLDDFTLEVLIDKNGGFFGDYSEVFQSKLTATYETGVIPEPASVIVWSGLVGIAGLIAYRKRASKQVA